MNLSKIPGSQNNSTKQIFFKSGQEKQEKIMLEKRLNAFNTCCMVDKTKTAEVGVSNSFSATGEIYRQRFYVC